MQQAMQRAPTFLSRYNPLADGGGDNNFGVDYVIHYKIPPKEHAEAEAGFVRLVESLTKVGLATEVRSGDRDSLLIFIQLASESILTSQIYHTRLQDWLAGVRAVTPDRDIAQAFRDEPICEAERLRLVYLLITKAKNDGGAGITPGHGPWKHVESVFPLHDHAFNKAWLKNWSSKYLLADDDLDEIRNKFGERVAFYFAFTQAYFRFLLFPAAFGFGAWMLFGKFSFVYALVSCLWSVVFFEYWKNKEVDLAVQWGVRGVSNIQRTRPEFKFEYEAEDPVTGEPVRVYSPLKRLQTQLLQIPFAAVCIVVLGCLIAACNSLEIFISEVYDGPLKRYLGFLPTILLVVLTPTASSVLVNFATRLTDWENYETIDAHHAAMVQKQFVLNFMTSYMPLLFTAFMYIPFPHMLEPLLGFWRATFQAVAFSEQDLQIQQFQADPTRITTQMFFYTVTAQFVSFATEVVVPNLKRKVFETVKDATTKRDHASDREEEAEFLDRVRHEMELPEYDVTEDYREMVMQFGYMSLFSVSFPLTSACFLINNWVELRSDALKIATTSKRPIPWRSDSIGPWLPALGFLSWLGSITSSAIVYLCRDAEKTSANGASDFRGWGLLLSILLAEHFYLVVQMGVGYAMSKVESSGLQKERRERYNMKKKVLMETLGHDIEKRSESPPVEHGEKINRDALEEEARKQSVRGGSSPMEMFWQRQRGMQETILVGRNLIQEIAR
jgi:anoctamin-10